MRIRWIIAGILVVVGAIWIGQGMGLFNGSGFMDNNRIWAVIGAVLIVAGVVVGWTAVRARPQV
jgi:hypothetical protein